MSLRVTSDSVVDGFHTFVVEIDDPATSPRRLEVIPRDGHYVVSGDGRELVREAPPGALPPEDGAPCAVSFLAGLCACGPSGPTHCISRDPELLGTLIWVGLATITAGFSTLGTGPPPEDLYVETRLIELDGSPVPVPEAEPARRRPRRR